METDTKPMPLELPKIMPTLTIKFDEKKRTSFRPSDFGKMSMELWLAMKNTPQTNPPKWFETLRWGAGHGVEAQMLKVLKDSGVVNPEYNQMKHGRLEFFRNGVELHGYTDAVTVEGEPVEIKSINNANTYDVKRYQNGEPRKNYVGQLAMYLDAMDRERGYLFAATVDGLHTFWLPCERIQAKRFRCGRIEVDLDEEYARYAAIQASVDRNEEPNWFEKVYKYDLDKIDWSKISKSYISEARNGRRVLGDWEILFSPYKDFFIEKQGATVGYSEEEIAKVRELTKGYSTW